MNRIVRLICCLALCLPFASSIALAQDYVYATGNPSFGVNIPIENGYINITNGNLHMEFPLATHKQRGALSLNERLVYDSRIWMIGHYSNYYWWPNNIPNTPNTQGGWRFVTGNEVGSLTYPYGNTQVVSTGCPAPPYDGQHTITTSAIAWNDPSGTLHNFTGTSVYEQDDCSFTSSQHIDSGYATDASGYIVQDDGSGNPVILDNTGNQVYPQVIDRFGNYWSTDSNGNLVDDLGRTPVIKTTSGNVTYYDVLAPNGTINNNGTRVRYTVTTTPVSVSTGFSQQAVNEWSGTLYPVQSIQLPDGTSYSFTYDSYGEITSVTLPTGGTVSYGWTNYQDSYNNKNRWLTSRTVGSDPATTFTPAVLTQCASNGTGCQEQVTLHKPSGDETVYQLTLNNGAWNTNIAAYTGSASGSPILSTANTYSYSCSGCSSLYITKSSSTTTQSNGLLSQQQYVYDSPWMGKPSKLLEWDYYSGSPSTTPTRETDYSYSGYDLHQTTILANGTQASQTTYDYTTSATATSGIPQHGSANAGGPYLQRTTDSSTGGTGLFTTYVFDDAGAVLSSTDGNGTTTYGHDSSDTFVTSVTQPTPSSGVVLSTSSGFDFNSGALTSTLDENSQSTNYNHYDTAGRPTEVDYPDTSTTTYSYGMYLSFHTSDTITPNSGYKSTLYDPYGRLSRVAVYNGQSTNSWYQVDRCYDSMGMLHFESVQYQGNGFSTPQQCSGNGTTYTYDALGRVTNINSPDGNTTYQYVSRAVKTTDVNNVQKITQYDAMGRIATVCEVSSNPLNGENPVNCGMDIPGTGFLTTYAYDLVNHKTTITQGVQQRVFQTDSLRRTIYTSEPERGVTTYSYSYNATGLQVIRKRPKANQCSANPAYPNQCDPTFVTTTTTQYDSVGRAVSINYDDNITTNKAYVYDQTVPYWGSVPMGASKGHLTFAQGSAEAIQLAYDSMGRVANTIQCMPGLCGTNSALDVWQWYHYDLAGNMDKFSYMTNNAVGTQIQMNYHYDPAGQLTSLDDTRTGTILNNIQNGPFGPATWSTGNSLTGIRGYDSVGRNNTVVYCSNGSTATDCGNGGASRVYGAWTGLSGNIVQWRCDSVINGCNDFQYDDMGRLSHTNSSGTRIYDFGYDRYGNRWQQYLKSGSGPSPTFAFNTANNQITSSGFSYDAAGNMTNDGSHSYIYDAEGKVLQMTSAATTAAYVYDALDHRVQTIVGGYVTLFAYNINGQRVASYDGWGNPVSNQVYAGGTPVAFYQGGSIHYQHQDWLGTERARTNSAGAIEGTYQSLPFGDNFTSTGTDNDAYHFAQLDRDADDTHHAQFRQYSSTQGRWYAPDPYLGSMDLNDPQSFNRYSYVGNNPLSGTDPSGLNALGILANIGLCFGGSAPGACIAEVTSGPVGWAVLGASALLGGLEALGLFAKPQFHGSLRPRPNVPNLPQNSGTMKATGTYDPATTAGDGTYTMHVGYSVPQYVPASGTDVDFPDFSAVMANLFNPDWHSTAWPYNGNLWSGVNNQDQLCSTEHIFGSKITRKMNNNPAILSCCKVHDDCYTKYSCNASSWGPGLPGACASVCNATVKSCIAKAIW